MTLLKVLSIIALTFLILFISVCIGVIVWTNYEHIEIDNNVLCPYLEEEKIFNQNKKLNNGVKIISKKQWNGACGRNGLISTNTPANTVVICHTATRQCSTQEDCLSLVKSFQDYHVDVLKKPDINYNFIIAGDNNIYAGTNWNLRQTHWNRIKISFIGNFARDEHNISMIENLKELLFYGLVHGHLSPDYIIVAHNQTETTMSPGVNVYKVIKEFPRFYPFKL